MSIWLLGLLFPLAVPLTIQQPSMLFRLPASSAPEAILLSPRSIAVGHADRVYVGDDSPARVLGFDSNGVFLRSIGREGEGPGEFRSPLVGAGAFLVVNDGQLKRLSAFDTSGTLLWTKPGTCCRSRPIRVDQTGRIYVVSSPLIIGGGLPLDDMVVFSKEGIPLDTIRVPGFGSGGEGKREWRSVSRQAAFAAGIPFMAAHYFAITRTGTVIWGHSKAYTLMEGRDASVPRVTIQRPWTATGLSVAERRRGREANIDYFARLVDRQTLDRLFDLNDVPQRAPAFFGLDVDACGRWWVLRTSVYMDAAATFDLYSSQGAPIGSVALAEHLSKDHLWAVGSQRLAAVIQDQDDAPRLAVYRIPPLPGCIRS